MKLSVRDVMTKKVVSVGPDDALEDVVQTLFQHGFDGLPVVDEQGKLLGIITQYDLVTKSSGLHLPTLEKVLRDIKVLKKDVGVLKKSFEEIHKLTAKDLMNPEPITTTPDTMIVEAAKVFVEHHRVNPVPVVDKDKKLVGILSRYDVIKLYELQFLGNAMGRHAETIEYENKDVEQGTKKLVGLMKKEFVLVSKWRSRFWYIIAGIFFIAGFIVALAWIIQVSIE